jgi:hypothetical protein
MTGTAPHEGSRSLRLYARLLDLYPPEFLRRHRAEMLQNFADLEDATASKTKLWLLIGKDLTMSLTSQLFASQLGSYVIAVLLTWILIFIIGYFTHGSTPGYPALHAFGGVVLGMLCMYVATRFYGTLPSQHSAYLIGVLVLCVVVFTIGYLRYRSMLDHPIVQVLGGVLLGMLSLSIAMRLYGTRQNSPSA